MGRGQSPLESREAWLSFEEASSVFLDPYFLATDDPTANDRFIALGFSRLARLLFVVHLERGEKVRIISARRASRSERRTYEQRRNDQVEPSEASLAEMPEVDFSRAIRPNKLAALRGDFKQAVFLDKELWQHFRTEERVLEALRMLVSLAERSSRSVA